MSEAAGTPRSPTAAELVCPVVARRPLTLISLFLALSVTGCGAGSSHTGSVSSSSPGAATTTAPASDAGTVTAAVSALQHAVRDRDVRSMCNLLLPATAVHAHGSPQAIRAAIAAQVRDCETGFGKRGEFTGYAPMVGARVTGTSVRGDLASVRIATSRGAGSLQFLRLAGRWRLLVAGS